MEQVANQQEHIERIPETHFEIIDTEEEARALSYFLKSARWKELFYKTFPELRDLKPSQYEDFLKQQHERCKDQLQQSKEWFEPQWKKIEQPYLETLAEHFETSWPTDKIIQGKISVLKIAFPRNIDDYSFFLGYQHTRDMIETAAHEILHFLWFKKWSEVFPDMPKDQYETPHLAWRLSEIMDQIILQCHPKLQELIKPKWWGYSSFSEITIEGKSMIDHFKELYEQSIANNNTFEATLKKLWAEALKYEKEISVF
jgi:hypothetical protein